MRLFALVALLFQTSAHAGYMLNDVTVAELAEIKGVGEDTAARIVALREARKGLGSVEELRILGLDGPTLQALRAELSAELTLKKVAKGSYTDVSSVLAHFSHEPDVLAVQGMAMDYTKTNPSLVEGWLAASKSA